MRSALTYLRCLDCMTPLDEAHHLSTHDVVECEVCAARYGMVLLEDADAEQWAWVSLTRAFCRACAPSPHDIIIHTVEGRVVPCPEHGPAPPMPMPGGA